MLLEPIIPQRFETKEIEQAQPSFIRRFRALVLHHLRAGARDDDSMLADLRDEASDTEQFLQEPPSHEAGKTAYNYFDLGLLRLRIARLVPDPNAADAMNEASAAFRQATAGIDQAADPTTWALAQNYLGMTLFHLARWQKNPDNLLAEAADAFERASETIPRDTETSDDALQVPAFTPAVIDFNLGAVLLTIGHADEDVARLTAAVGHLARAEASLAGPEVIPYRLIVRNNLAFALARLGELRDDPEQLRRAVAMAQGALEDLGAPGTHLWAHLKDTLGYGLMILGGREQDPGMLEDAVAAFREAREVWEARGDPHNAGSAKAHAERARGMLDAVLQQRALQPTAL